MATDQMKHLTIDYLNEKRNSLISSNQTVYLNGRFISEGRCLISDIFEVSDLLKLKGLLLTVDTEKVFNCVNHIFLLKH